MSERTATVDDVRATRLNAINDTLAAHGLSPLPRLGDHTKDEVEFTKIIEVHTHSARFFTDIKFACRFPNGEEGEYTVRWNANSATASGTVMVVLIDGKFAIVKSFRPTLGTWLPEIPRGFGESLDNAKINGKLGMGIRLGDLPLGTVIREIGEEVLEGCTINNFAYLGGIAQDSGTQATVTNYPLVSIALDEDGKARLAERKKQLSNEGHRLYLWTYDQLDAAIGTQIVDAHSLTAIRLYEKHVRSLPITA